MNFVIKSLQGKNESCLCFFLCFFLLLFIAFRVLNNGLGCCIFIRGFFFFPSLGATLCEKKKKKICLTLGPGLIKKNQYSCHVGTSASFLSQEAPEC